MKNETSTTYHLKVMANVNLQVKFVMDRETDNGTTLYVPDLLMQGHNKTAGTNIFSFSHNAFYTFKDTYYTV